MSKHKALVTGGARGIGSAIVTVLERNGIEVLAPTRQQLDLASPESIERFVVDHSDAGIDILVNNAGINILNRAEDITDPDWAQMVQVNLTAPFKLIQGLCHGMKARGWGRIVNISSVFSQVTKEKRAAYSATKSGLNGLTRTLAVELAPHQILVNSVCPGYVETELTRKNNSPADLEAIRATIPTQRLAQPEEIAKFVAFLCSDENTYITGQMLTIDGGFMLR